MESDLLRISPKITVCPVIHGSGDFALEVRRVMLDGKYDCLAIPLPPSFQDDVTRAVEWLPTPTVVIQRETPKFETEWSPDNEFEIDEEDDDEDGFDLGSSLSYVPIDPCQPVIAAIRFAKGERIACEFVDAEVSSFQPNEAIMPDPYAVKKVRLEWFAAAILPRIERPYEQQVQSRIVHMARRLRELESRYDSILMICSVVDWPWLREAYVEHTPDDFIEDETEDTEVYGLEDKSHHFVFGELPFITGLYERARSELEDDDNLSIDGVKELLIAARKSYLADFKGRSRKISTHLLSCCLKYIRNLTLFERRFTPDLYTIIVAAKQICGDGYALHVAETAQTFPYTRELGLSNCEMSIDRMRLPDDEIFYAVSRLPGQPIHWRTCELNRRPDPENRDRWKMNWNPMGQCSWPPEDEKIENFRSHVFDRAKQIMGADLIKTEKFTTSIKDGIDIRDTLRNWHTGEIYVKELPPSRGNLDAAVMLFDSPADPRDYPWRTTWFAEHENESTLAFFGTNFGDEMVGPGIALATYGGAMFLFPPVSIPDIWHDPRLDFTETLEERVLAAACLHSQCPQIALLSPLPPGAGWRRLAQRFKKKWIHVPLGQFSDSTIQQLRMVHVLNGHQIRSFAAHFIRKA